MSEKEGVFKVSVPRSDLDITVAGVKMTPPLGLTSWAAFQKAGEQVMVMGDMVMLEDQVNPVMSVALENGPGGHSASQPLLLGHTQGDVHAHRWHGRMRTKLAGGGRQRCLPRSRKPSGGRGEVPRLELEPCPGRHWIPKSSRTSLACKGQLANGVYKITIGRTTTMHGHAVGNTMGVNTWAAFAGSDEQAIVDGDFIMFEREVQPVLKALRSAGIHIVALHHHMIEESPRTVFLHYWGVGPTRELAKGLKAALDTQSK